MKRPKVLVTSLSIVLVVLIAGGVLLYRANQTPTKVFWDMLANNLSTSGVTRSVTQSSSGLSVSQYTQLSLGQKPTAQAITSFKQNGGTIVTQEISNQTSDYVRYKQIIATHKNSAGKAIDTSSVVNKWAKLNATDTLSSSVTSGLFDQSLLGVLPIANLEPTTRNQLLSYMRDNSIFSFDASKVTTTTLAGRKVYQYAVTVKPATYIALMQQFGKLVGANEYASLNPSSYAGAASLSLRVSIDVASHNLAEIYQADTSHTERYSGFGIAPHVILPTATLTTSELEKRITALQ